MSAALAHIGSAEELNDLVSAEIRSLCGRYRVPQGRIADAIGVTQSAVSKRLRGVTPWTLPEISLVAEVFGMSAIGLLTRAAHDETPHQLPDTGPQLYERRTRRDSNPQPADP